MYNFLIELQSPLCAGSGGPGPGYVDRDVVFDGCGLPYIPARRLKGLLRTGFLDVTSSLHLQNSQIDFTELENQLFGVIGNHSPGTLRLRNAILCSPNEKSARPDHYLADWLKSIMTRNSGKPNGNGILYREEVLDAYTETRRQTRIDRRTGTAAENSLRVTRSLRSGLRFSAELRADCELPASAEYLLALSAAAVQQMGSSRTRGLGLVRCSLWRDDQDLTGDALAALRADMLDSRAISHAEKPKAPASMAASGPLQSLRFRLTLNQPVLFPTLAGDPNMVASLDYVPGSSLQGWLAARFVEQHPDDEVFLSLFCRGRLRFLAAYPEIPDSNTGRPVRAHPVPFLLREEKNRRGAYRNLLSPDADWSELKKFERQWTFPAEALYGGRLSEVKVAKELQYHHAQSSGDRRIGRPIGREQMRDYGLEEGMEGAFFSYEQIKPGAAFIGAVLGDSAALHHLRELLGDEPPQAVLGRSRSGQYGGDARWEWLDSTPVNDRETAWLGRVPEFGVGTRVLAMLLSPLLMVNDNGHPVPEFPLNQLRAASGLDIEDEYITFARDEWIGGYLTHQRLPRQQLPAIAAGSIFQLQLAKPYQHEELRAAAERVAAASFGIRPEQGYGRMALLPASGLQKTGIVTEYRMPQTKGGKIAPHDSAAWKLALGVYRRRLMDKVRDDALEVASDRKTRYSPSLTQGLLFRLGERTETRFDDLRAALGRFRRHAHDRMESCRIFRKPFDRTAKTGSSLEEFVLDVAEKSSIYYATLLRDSYSWQQWDAVFGSANPLANDAAFSKQLMTIYITTFLNGLAFRVREERKQGTKRGNA